MRDIATRPAHMHGDHEVVVQAERPPQARTVTVIEVRFNRGEGCCDQDLVRQVVAYYSLEGEFLAECDECGS